MTESFEAAVESTVEYLIGYVFMQAPNKTDAIQFSYEFSSDAIAELAIKQCSQIGMSFEKMATTRNPFAYQVVLKDVLRTKFFIAMRCSNKLAKYKKQGRAVDFACYGQEWKPPDSTPRECLSPLQQIYNATYGRPDLQ
jgi:hypothetical protein